MKMTLEEIEAALAADIAARLADTDANRAEARYKENPTEKTKRTAAVKREIADEMVVHFLTATQRQRLQTEALPLQAKKHNEERLQEIARIKKLLANEQQKIEAFEHGQAAELSSAQQAIDAAEYRAEQIKEKLAERRIKLALKFGELEDELAKALALAEWAVQDCQSCGARYIRKHAGNRRCLRCASKKE